MTPRRRTSRTMAAACTLAVSLLASGWASGTDGGAPVCGPELLELDGSFDPEDAETHQLLPFEVPERTSRVEVAYAWAPVGAGVLDLGLWDNDGTSGPDAFRFWSGSRQGRLDRDMEPVLVTADRNERTVVAGEVDAGTWHLELGVAALDEPTDWTVEIRCPAGDSGDVLDPDRVDAGLVIRDEPGWYAGDFHLHGFHSSPDGPDEQDMVDIARAAGLDIVPVTEYVSPAHWDRLGPAQRDNPDVLLWPGREVITYQGHVVVLGETSDSVEYRLGFDGTTLGDIQRAAVDQGALVSLAHPTLFPPETFGDTCRGCFLEAIDQVDWEATELVEVVTEGVVAEVDGVEVPNPFVATAVELWEEQLRAGNRLTAVSGSDDKEGDRYGNTKTMVWATDLSRSAVDSALRSGHAYVRGLGDDSPIVTMTASVNGPDSAEAQAMMGETLVADAAKLTVTVAEGDGHFLALRRDGTEVERIPIDGDKVTHTFSIERDPDSGPLGTFYGVEVLDVTTIPGAQLRTVITNPVFLDDTPADPIPSLQPAGYYGDEAGVQTGTHDTDTGTGTGTDDDNDTDANADGSRTNGGTWPVLVLVVVVLGLGMGGFFVARRHFPTDPT